MQDAPVNGPANYENFQETKEDNIERKNSLRCCEYSLMHLNFTLFPVNLFSPELCDDNLVEHGVQIHSASSVYERSEYSIKCCNPLCVTMLPQIPQISMLEVIDFLHVAFLGLVYKTNQGICKLCSTS